MEERLVLSAVVAVVIHGQSKSFTLNNDGQLFDTTDVQHSVLVGSGVNQIAGVENHGQDGQLLVLFRDHQLAAYQTTSAPIAGSFDTLVSQTSSSGEKTALIRSTDNVLYAYVANESADSASSLMSIVDDVTTLVSQKTSSGNDTALFLRGPEKQLYAYIPTATPAWLSGYTLIVDDATTLIKQTTASGEDTALFLRGPEKQLYAYIPTTTPAGLSGYTLIVDDVTTLVSQKTSSGNDTALFLRGPEKQLYAYIPTATPAWLSGYTLIVDDATTLIKQTTASGEDTALFLRGPEKQLYAYIPTTTPAGLSGYTLIVDDVTTLVSQKTSSGNDTALFLRGPEKQLYAYIPTATPAWLSGYTLIVDDATTLIKQTTASGEDTALFLRGPEKQLYAYIPTTTPAGLSGYTLIVDDVTTLVSQKTSSGNDTALFLRGPEKQLYAYIPTATPAWLSGYTLIVDDATTLIKQTTASGEDTALFLRGPEKQLYAYIPTTTPAGLSGYTLIVDDVTTLVSQKTSSGNDTALFLRGPEKQLYAYIPTATPAWLSGYTLIVDDATTLIKQTTASGEDTALFLRGPEKQLYAYIPTITPAWLSGYTLIIDDATTLIEQTTASGEDTALFLRGPEKQLYAYIPTVTPAWHSGYTLIIDDATTLIKQTTVTGGDTALFLRGFEQTLYAYVPTATPTLGVGYTLIVDDVTTLIEQTTTLGQDTALFLRGPEKQLLAYVPTANPTHLSGYTLIIDDVTVLIKQTTALGQDTALFLRGPELKLYAYIPTATPTAGTSYIFIIDDVTSLIKQTTAFGQDTALFVRGVELTLYAYVPTASPSPGLGYTLIIDDVAIVKGLVTAAGEDTAIFYRLHQFSLFAYIPTSTPQLGSGYTLIANQVSVQIEKQQTSDGNERLLFITYGNSLYAYTPTLAPTTGGGLNFIASGVQDLLTNGAGTVLYGTTSSIFWIHPDGIGISLLDENRYVGIASRLIDGTTQSYFVRIDKTILVLTAAGNVATSTDDTLKIKLENVVAVINQLKEYADAQQAHENANAEKKKIQIQSQARSADEVKQITTAAAGIIWNNNSTLSIDSLITLSPPTDGGTPVSQTREISYGTAQQSSNSKTVAVVVKSSDSPDLSNQNNPFTIKLPVAVSTGSPALWVQSGNLTIDGFDFTNDVNVDSPTILVTGGTLTLIHSRIRGGVGNSNPAILVSGGTLIMGSPDKPGGNAMVIYGPGQFIVNTGGTVSEFGNVFGINDVPVSTGISGLPTTVAEGTTTVISASTTVNLPSSLTYAWSVKRNGTAVAIGTGASYNFLADDSGAYDISLSIMDSSGGVISSSQSSVTVTNVNPTAAITTPIDGYQGVVGQARTFTLSATDVSSVDQASPFNFHVDWGDGSPASTYVGQSNSVNVQHVFLTTGLHHVTVTATDKDGGISSVTTRDVTILAQERQGTGLAIGGTTGDDTLTVTYVSSTSATLLLNAGSSNTVSIPSGGIFFYGQAGSDAVLLNGSAGVDDINLNANEMDINGLSIRSQDVESERVFGLGGNDQFHLFGGTFAIDGGAGIDELIGPDLNATWSISGTNSGSALGSTFANVEQLTGGSKDDTFSLTGIASVTGLLSGGGGMDTLNYSSLSRAAVVNLLAGTATGTAGISQFERMIGSAFADTLIATNVANTWIVDGANQGTLNGDFRFANVESLAGGAANDLYQFLEGGSLTGTVNAGGGSDTADFSLQITPVSINFQSLSASTINKFTSIESFIGTSGNADQLIGASVATNWVINKRNGGTNGSIAFDGFEKFLGGSSNDKFIFSTASSTIEGTIDGGAGVDTFVASDIANEWNLTGSGTGKLNSVTSFLGLENLTGGSSSDHFQLTDDGAISGTLSGGAGADSLDYSAAHSAVTVNLQGPQSATNVAAFNSIESFVGSSLSDTLRGSSTATTWYVNGANSGLVGAIMFASFENLQGGAGYDNFNFANATSSINGVISGGDGTDTLIGAPVANEWNITGLGTGTITGRAQFSGIENLTGTSAPDTFRLLPGGQIAGTISGSTGLDTIDFSQRTSAVTVDLQVPMNTTSIGLFSSIENFIGSSGDDILQGTNSPTPWLISGFNEGKIGASTFSGFENLRGGSGTDNFTFGSAAAVLRGTVDGGDGADTIIGPAVASEWTIDGPGQGRLLGQATFAGFENITGGLAADAFRVLDGGLVSGTLSGGSGPGDTLDFSARSGPIFVDLRTSTADGINRFIGIDQIIGTAEAGDFLRAADANNTWKITGANSGTVASFTFLSFENLVGGTANDVFTLTASSSSISGSLDGGAGNDTLIGANFDNTWDLGGVGAGAVNGTLNFQGVENLTGGSSVDLFRFNSPAGFTNINGGLGNNVLDYSAWSTNVTVNLQTGAASAINGLVSNVFTVIGGNGDDNLTGRATASSILVGGNGNDTLIGGSGRDILIGGSGADNLSGGAGDDIMIGATTVWDTNASALFAMSAEWNSTRNYATRVGNLRGTISTTPANGAYYLRNMPTDSTMNDNGSIDTLAGGTGQDWFIAGTEDVLPDRVTASSSTKEERDES